MCLSPLRIKVVLSHTRSKVMFLLCKCHSANFISKSSVSQNVYVDGIVKTEIIKLILWYSYKNILGNNNYCNIYTKTNVQRNGTTAKLFHPVPDGDLSFVPLHLS